MADTKKDATAKKDGTGARAFDTEPAARRQKPSRLSICSPPF